MFRSTVAVEAEELLRLRAGVAAGELLGPRIYTAGEWYTDTSTSVAGNVEAYKAAGYDLLKVHDEPPGPWLDSLVDAARRVGMPIAGHPVGGLAYALEHRFTSVEHLIGFPGGMGAAISDSLADTVEIPGIVAKIVQAGTRVTPTLAWGNASDGVKMNPHYLRGQRYIPAKYRDFYRYLGPDTAARTSKASDALPSKVVAVRKVRRRLITALQHAGVELLAGTDSPFLVPGYGVHQELEALVRWGGLTPYQALRTATRNVASYFGTLDSTGTVGVGQRADLVLLDANPLTDIRHTERIAGVMAAGRWISAADIERRLDAYAKDPGKD